MCAEEGEWIYWAKDGKYGAARQEGRLQRSFMDVVKQDVQRVGVTEENTRDRVRWRKIIYWDDP